MAAAGLTEPRCASERGLAMGGGRPRSAASRWEAAANPWLGAIARCSRTGSSNPSPSSGESGANLSLARVRLPTSRSRGFPRVCGLGRAARSTETRKVQQHRAEERWCLCRAIFQYRSVAAPFTSKAMRSAISKPSRCQDLRTADHPQGSERQFLRDKGLEGASHHAVIPNVNTVDVLREIWPRLSIDEKKLFDVIARTYLAAVMLDFRYRQTTATLDVRGFSFRAVGRQPTDLGWRAAFPDWQPADEKGDDAQLLPVLRNGEIARLENPTIEDKETRPPPRYNEGTLIEAMQNAWRFVDDEVLRERLKEAKGIGTPATRAEIIGGLKKQGFLIAQGRNILPTETGLSLFGVLEQADPALVDPGVTAQLECSLDEVVIGSRHKPLAQ